MTEEQSPTPDAPSALDDSGLGGESAPTRQSPPVAAPQWKRWLREALPHLLTAFVAVALALTIERAWPQRGSTIVVPVRPTLVATSAPTAPPPAQPTDTVPQPQPDERVLSQEIVDLHVRLDEVWSSVYIARAAAQVTDAESALQDNDAATVERVLVAVDASLALAYERSGDLNKGPIGEFRSQVSQIRDDLYVRPEGLDQKMRVLRQRMLSFVEEP